VTDPAGDALAAHRRVLFIHVMKTGGTTLLTALGQQLEPDELYPDRTEDMAADASTRIAFRHMTLKALEKIPEERRRRIRVFVGHFPYLAKQVIGGELDVITVLRDPVERTISLLRQFQRPAALWLESPPRAALGDLSLEEVYEQPLVFDPLVLNHQTKLFSMTEADEPGGYMHPIDVDDRRLQLAKQNLAEVDVVGITERYDAFIDEVTRRYGWRVSADARLNAAPVDEGFEVSDALRRRIAEDNAIDVELYEFARQLIAERGRSR
jgi:hypothetical protein